MKRIFLHLIHQIVKLQFESMEFPSWPSPTFVSLHKSSAAIQRSFRPYSQFPSIHQGFSVTSPRTLQQKQLRLTGRTSTRTGTTGPSPQRQLPRRARILVSRASCFDIRSHRPCVFHRSFIHPSHRDEGGFDWSLSPLRPRGQSVWVSSF